MRYLLLCCTNEKDWKSLPASERVGGTVEARPLV
jgi:hypothetical protein